MLMRQEYPRPRLVREKWQNLNGEWDFLIDHGVSGKERKFWENADYNMKINVPFAPESKLSGIEYVDFMKSVWYRRTFKITAAQLKGRVILHFGAVDYFTEVWINKTSVGTHTGGYTPFSFDITDKVHKGENEIVLNAYDDTRNTLQPSGKQVSEYANNGCMYTRTTGIWQTVWLEFVPEIFVEKLKLTPDVDNKRIYIVAQMNKVGADTFKAEASLNGKKVGCTEAKICGKAVETFIDIPKPELWEPGKPVLYDLKVNVGEDECLSYFGMRKVAIKGYAIEINDKPVYQRLVLDQGFYPDGIYTAPSDEDLKKDIELSMAAGFNGARLHMKVFEPRLIYWADKLGYMVWDEFPNWGLDTNRPEALLSILPEWIDEIERDYSSPAVIGWCPFNELWDTKRLGSILTTMYDVTRAIDPFRPIIDTSGYIHIKTDIYDVHDYEQDPEVFAQHHAPLAEGKEKIFMCYPDIEKYEGQPYFVSEFGGTWWNIDNDGQSGWGYGKSPEDLEEFYKRYEGLIDVLLSNPKMCAFCYTQLTDVFQERNGIYSFGRVAKFDNERLYKINTKKAAIEK